MGGQTRVREINSRILDHLDLCDVLGKGFLFPGFFFFFLIFIYFLIWLSRVFVAACGIFVVGMWDLVP